MKERDKGIEIKFPTNSTNKRTKRRGIKERPLEQEMSNLKRIITEFNSKININVFQIYFCYQSNFSVTLKERIISNMAEIDKKDKKLFLYAIIFRPEDIYEVEHSPINITKGVLGEGEKEGTTLTLRLQGIISIDEFTKRLNMGNIKVQFIELLII